MTVSVKSPTSTTGSIQLNGSDVLTIDSSGNVTAPNKLISTGHVLQVVSNEHSTTTGIGSATYVDSGITATITPSSASSKILVMVSISGRTYSNSNFDRIYFINVVRNSTQVHEVTTLTIAGVGATGYRVMPMKDIMYLDSPATTSSITYKIQFKISDITYDTRMRTNEYGGSSIMTLMEVAG